MFQHHEGDNASWASVDLIINPSMDTMFDVHGEFNERVITLIQNGHGIFCRILGASSGTAPSSPRVLLHREQKIQIQQKVIECA